MLLRRTFLKGLASLFSFLLPSKIVAALPRPEPDAQPPGFIDLPDWCPPGWVPQLGQIITKEQFPFLFDAEPGVPQRGRRRYLSPFFGKTEAGLNNVWPHLANEIRRSGYQDHYTRIMRTGPDNRVPVALMATRAQCNACGKVFPAGFQFTILVEQEDFEKFYGPLEPGPKNAYGADFQAFGGYDPVKFG
jgi:hypothetical protein